MATTILILQFNKFFQIFRIFWWPDDKNDLFLKESERKTALKSRNVFKFRKKEILWQPNSKSWNQKFFKIFFKFSCDQIRKMIFFIKESETTRLFNLETWKKFPKKYIMATKISILKSGSFFQIFRFFWWPDEKNYIFLEE